MSLSNCVRPPAIIGLITGLGFFGVFWWGLGARGAPLRVLGGLGFLGVSGKIRRCELRSLMMGIDKRFC
ncbi:hypothetical protein [Microcystis aeruginosa]|uniref:hypothetical protein n=1 Tax=Microcystis aeruginosa TaxID=1126 RepID=UPI001C205C28|nr:hypothetical protein [Microcystis aeruginosa]